MDSIATDYVLLMLNVIPLCYIMSLFKEVYVHPRSIKIVTASNKNTFEFKNTEILQRSSGNTELLEAK